MTSIVGQKVVFIAGSGHSGSTLLDMCLGGHPQIASLGETGFLYFYAHGMTDRDFCTCGQRVLQCDFWRKNVAELARQRGVAEDVVLDSFIMSDPEQIRFDDKGEYKEWLPHEKRTDKISFMRPFTSLLGNKVFFKKVGTFSKLLRMRWRAAENRMDLCRVVMAAQHRPIVVDSTKSPGSLKEAWMLRGDTPVKFIVMHRDGRGVAASHMRRLGVTMSQASRMWRNEIIKWWLVSRTIPKADIYTVHYESFATDPAYELRKICDWLGIDFSPEMMDFRQNRHNIGGNPMRFRREETVIRIDESWREMLSEADRNRFELVAGWVNRLLGYR